MLIVPTYVSPSKIPSAGLGLFSKLDIRPSTVVWRKTSDSFFVIDRQKAATLPEQAYGFLRTYATLRDSGWELAWDNSRFINHADDPNLIFDHCGNLVSARLISAGDELTEDYRLLGEIEPLAEGLPEIWMISPPTSSK